MAEPYPVVIGVCLDAETIWTGRDPSLANRPVLLSHGAFAIREGLAPLLDTFDRHGAKATFFVPGATADRYPDAVRTIDGRGHELGSHGHAHRPVHALDTAQERDELVRGIDSIAQIVGRRVNAWRSPSWEWSAATLDLLLDNSVTVSTSFHDRLRPYRHTKDDKPVDLVELPVQWHLADAPYFFYGGQIGRVIHPAADVQRIWEEEFDALTAMPGTFYHLTLHVQLIGHPGRLRMLDRHLAHIRAHGAVRFLTASELAATVA